MACARLEVGFSEVKHHRRFFILKFLFVVPSYLISSGISFQNSCAWAFVTKAI